MSAHECPAPGCSRLVPSERLACPHHWYSIAKPLRDALWRAYNGPGAGSPEHTAAVEACIRALGGERPDLSPEAELRRAFSVPEGVAFERPPVFLMVGNYAGAWKAWGRIQRAGPTAPDESGDGWRVSSFPRDGGGCTMRLEVDFVPTRPS